MQNIFLFFLISPSKMIQKCYIVPLFFATLFAPPKKKSPRLISTEGLPLLEVSMDRAHASAAIMRLSAGPTSGAIIVSLVGSRCYIASVSREYAPSFFPAAQAVGDAHVYIV